MVSGTYKFYFSSSHFNFEFSFVARMKKNSVIVMIVVHAALVMIWWKKLVPLDLKAEHNKHINMSKVLTHTLKYAFISSIHNFIFYFYSSELITIFFSKIVDLNHF